MWVPLNVPNLQVSLRQFTLQAGIVMGLLCQLAEIFQRPLHSNCRAGVEPGRFWMALWNSNKKEVVNFRTSLNCCRALARSTRAIRACREVVTIPPTNDSAINATAATPALFLRTNLSVR